MKTKKEKYDEFYDIHMKACLEVSDLQDKFQEYGVDLDGSSFLEPSRNEIIKLLTEYEVEQVILKTYHSPALLPETLTNWQKKIEEKYFVEILQQIKDLQIKVEFLETKL